MKNEQQEAAKVMYEGQPPFKPDTEFTDEEREAVREAVDEFLKSQVMVERPLIAHMDKAFHQGVIWSRNRYGIQHSRLPADGWRKINGVEDLPKDEGSYLWRYVGVKGYESFKVQYFTPRHSAEWFASMYSHWRRITPPTEKEER